MPRNSNTTETVPSTAPAEKLERCALYICVDCGYRSWTARAVGRTAVCCLRCGSQQLDSTDGRSSEAALLRPSE